jgi:hypothetical protein
MYSHYFLERQAKERQREISKDLAVRHMLKEANGGQRPASHPKRLVLMGVPAVVAIVVLMLVQVF